MAATVTVGNITADDNALYAKPPSDGIWVDGIIRNRYEKDRHIYQLGIQSPGGFDGASVAFVQLASPTLLWICDWTLSKVNAQPNPPNPDPLDSNWILLDDWWQLDSITMFGADSQTPVYRISGTYVYGHKNPAASTNLNTVFPAVPWLNLNKITTSNRTLPSTYFMQGLSNLGVSSVGSGGLGPVIE